MSVGRFISSLLLGWLAGILAMDCKGAGFADDGPKYSVRTWQTDDGLPRNTINAIAQTPNGYLWLGTPFGVIRFDGTTFTRMEGDFDAGFTRARSRVLYTDTQGRLWIGTGTIGIIRHDEKAFTFIDSRNGLPHPTVSSLCEDLQGTVWIGSQDGFLSWVDAEDRVRPVPAFRGTRIAEPVQLVRDIRGTLWFAQRNAFGQLAQGIATNVTTVTNANVVLTPSRDGGMWVSIGNTLQKLNAERPEEVILSIPSPVKPNQLPVLFEDSKGNLWVGTQRDGVYRLSGREFVREFNTPHRVFGIFEDVEENIWIGTEGGGLTRLRPAIFQSLTMREGLPQSMVRSICEAPNGDIWFSGQGPVLMRWSDDAGLQRVPGLTNIGITSVLPNPEGGIWAGTVGWGLLALDGSQSRQVVDGPMFRNRQIRAMHRDAQGQLWLGCLPDGLMRVSGDKVTPPEVFFELGLPPDAIWSIASDEHGKIWLGTIGGELLCYGEARFIKYGTKDGLPGASIAALHFTPDGELWIGTLGGGLGRFKNGRFSFAHVHHGLADGVISSIVDDGAGFFWLSSDLGVSRVRKQDLDEVADGRRDRVVSIRYGRDDDLANVECVGGYQPAAWRTHAGNLWFATSKGAVMVNPAATPTNATAPKLVLERVLLDDVEVTNHHDLKLAYGYRKLDFEFTAPSFSAPEQVSFRHQLVGWDADWVEDGPVRAASYPRLAPGKYEFLFTARNREGIWNERPVSIPFEVTPAIWQTAWFRLADLLLFGALVASAVRYRYVLKMRRKLRRLEQARAVEQERMRIARDIHDDLGARLTQMAFLSDMVAGEVGQQGKAGERLDKLANSSREAIRSLDEIVWAVNPRKDSLPEFVDYLSHHANEFFRTSNTRCWQCLPMMIPNLPLPTDVRHHLFLACKEALNNASKHAKATEVWLSLKVTGSDLDIIIEDNGHGFAGADSVAGGNGLANMNNRLATIGGTCRVTSRPGQGTRVQFQIKIPSGPAGTVLAAPPEEPPR